MPAAKINDVWAIARETGATIDQVRTVLAYRELPDEVRNLVRPQAYEITLEERKAELLAAIAETRAWLTTITGEVKEAYVRISTAVRDVDQVADDFIDVDNVDYPLGEDLWGWLDPGEVNVHVLANNLRGAEAITAFGVTVVEANPLTKYLDAIEARLANPD